MSIVEVVILAMRIAGFIALYVFIGFGPGFVIGLMLGNFVFGRGKPTLMQKHDDNKESAAQHNAQWDPAHEKWQK